MTGSLRGKCCMKGKSWVGFKIRELKLN